MPDADGPPSLETPTERIAHLADALGTFASHVPTRAWGDAELERLRPHMLRVAVEVLTSRQLVVFASWLGGASCAAVAAQTDTTKQSVHEALMGKKQPDGTMHGGALPKLGRALDDDDGFKAEVGAIEKEREADCTDSLAVTWYLGSRPEHFIPLGVLLLAHLLSDARREVSLADLYAHAPRQVVDHAVPLLRVGGWCTFDGARLRILKTPQGA